MLVVLIVCFSVLNGMFVMLFIVCKLSCCSCFLDLLFIFYSVVIGWGCRNVSVLVVGIMSSLLGFVCDDVSFVMNFVDVVFIE